MNGKDCQYCGYALCECGEAYRPEWIPVKERLPDQGVPVLWCDPTDSVWPTFVGKRDGKSIDWGGDLAIPLQQVMHWMNLPEPPAVRTTRRNKNP
jgi:hypothetical protein